MKKSKLTLVCTKKMSREEWLAERRKAIGGSDAAAIIGLNAYVTPYAVWADKTGRLPEKPDSEAMRQGRDFEQYVADRFTEKSRKKTHRVNAIIQNPDYPWASANIDRDIVGEESGLECKTTSIMNLKKFKDGEFPESYYVQSCHYLAVTEYRRWYVAVLVLNQGFMIYQLTRIPDDGCPDWCESSVYVSDDEIAALMDAERDFWELVKSDTPPDLTGRKPDSDTLAAVYNESVPNEEPIYLSEQEETIRRYIGLKNQIRMLEDEAEQYKQAIQAELGENELGQTSEWAVTWKGQSRRTFDAKEFQKANPHIDLSPYYKTSSFRKFDVKPLAD